MKLLSTFIFTASLFLFTACDSPDLGVPESEMEEVKKSCWWCGDYVCRKGGKTHKNGDTMRICSPTAKTTCPQKQKLGDGSEWALASNCRCQ